MASLCGGAEPEEENNEDDNIGEAAPIGEAASVGQEGL